MAPTPSTRKIEVGDVSGTDLGWTASHVGPPPEAKTLSVPPGVNFNISPPLTVVNSAAKRLPASSKARPRALVSPLAKVLSTPFEVNLRIVSLPAVPDPLKAAAKRLPALSKANPVNPTVVDEAKTLCVPPGVNFNILSVVAPSDTMKRLPAWSKARPKSWVALEKKVLFVPLGVILKTVELRRISSTLNKNITRFVYRHGLKKKVSAKARSERALFSARRELQNRRLNIARDIIEEVGIDIKVAGAVKGQPTRSVKPGSERYSAPAGVYWKIEPTPLPRPPSMEAKISPGTAQAVRTAAAVKKTRNRRRRVFIVSSFREPKRRQAGESFGFMGLTRVFLTQSPSA